MISIFPNFERKEVERLLLLYTGGERETELTLDLLHGCYYLLNLVTDSDEDNAINYSLALSIICHVSDSAPNDALICEILHACIVSSRVFLYSDMIDKINPGYKEKVSYSLFDEISKEYYRQEKTLTVLTKDQKRLIKFFEENRRIIVSAPTSFGKSRVIEEIIISNNYVNIFIVLPTIALLNETFLRFKSNKAIATKYNIYNTTNISEEKVEYGPNIFILTPEKTDVILEAFPKLRADFFVIDEIYKIKDRSDERSQVFVNCLYRLLKFKCDFYLIGPYFDSFSQKFIERTQSKFIKFSSELVQKQVVNIHAIQPNSRYHINGSSLTKLINKNRDGNLKHLIQNLNSQSIVYVGTSSEVETRARNIAKTIDDISKSALASHISETISSEWSLVVCLQKRVAFHHGAIPRYIQNEIIELFNNYELDSIVCSTTITEGVNTSAKNVIIFDNMKGGEPLTNFDIKNIKGRAGRFKEHFVGRVFTLTELPPEDIQENDIGFSYFDEDNLKHEELIQVDRAELNGSNLTSIEFLEFVLREVDVDIRLIKANKFVSVEGQLELIALLRDNKHLKDVLKFDGIPNSSQVEILLELVFVYLFSPQDKEHKTYTLLNLTRWVKHRLYNNYSIKQFIPEMIPKGIDSKIRNVFKLHRDYFEFKFPKCLIALENILNYVYSNDNWGDKSSAFNFGYLIAKIEFGYTQDHIICMREADLPIEIILKIEESFADCYTVDEIRNRITSEPSLLNNLSDFEKRITKKYL
jgi:helicase